MLRGLIDEFRAVKDPAWGRWAAGDDFTPSGNTASGVVVNDQSSMQLLTVYGCVTQIADVMSTMPVDQFTRQGGTQRPVTPTAAWLTAPNTEMDWSTFVASCMWSLLLDGNAFIVVTRSTARSSIGVSELHLLDPHVVTVDREPGSRRKRFTVMGTVFTGEMLHVVAYLWPGEVRGVDPINYARQAIGFGLAAQEFGSALLGNNAVPGGVIEAPGQLSDDQRKDLRENWARRHQGPRNAGRIGLLTGGATFKPMTISPEQAQFIESRRFSATEIAANLFHVPPDMVGVAIEGKGITYQNLEHRWTEFIRRACMPWMTRLERSLSGLLPRPQYIKFVPDVYLRPDTKTRYETHRIAIESGLAKPSERRELEDLPYLPEADILYAPGASSGGAPATAEQVEDGDTLAQFGGSPDDDNE